MFLARHSLCVSETSLRTNGPSAYENAIFYAQKHSSLFWQGIEIKWTPNWKQRNAYAKEEKKTMVEILSSKAIIWQCLKSKQTAKLNGSSESKWNFILRLKRNGTNWTEPNQRVEQKCATSGWFNIVSNSFISTFDRLSKHENGLNCETKTLKTHPMHHHIHLKMLMIQ